MISKIRINVNKRNHKGGNECKTEEKNLAGGKKGSIIMGMSAALFERITLEDGRVVQSNFDDYRIARMRDTPEINVTIVQSDAAPTGAGEVGTSPIVPAITNAIFAATGVRLRRLPIGRQKLV